MMQSLRSRFILSHLLPILLVVPLVGLILIFLLETQVLLTDMSTDITDKAQLIAEGLQGRPEVLQDGSQAEAFIARTALILDSQVVLLEPNGNLLARSDQNFPAINTAQLETAVANGQATQLTYGLREQGVLVLVPVTGINEQLLGIVAVTETLSSAATIFSRLRWLIIVIVASEIVLGCLIGFWLAVRLARPIDLAAAGVINIAKGEHIDPVSVEGPTEVRELATAVNTLSTRLRLLEDTRRRLLANLVHELGRPLGAMRAAVHVLRQEAGEDPQIREELLGGVETEIERLQPLLNDLAQLHGQVLGTLELNRQPTLPSDWLPSLLLPWRAAAQEKNLSWQAKIDPDLPQLHVDRVRLAQVIGNLCSNAIKYTPAGGQVMVTAVADSEEVHIAISDTGPGIIAAEQETVFEPFFRSQQERRFPQGLGLGLTIAQDITNAHGGWLELQSQPGKGSNFIIHLSIKQDTAL